VKGVHISELKMTEAPK